MAISIDLVSWELDALRPAAVEGVADGARAMLGAMGRNRHSLNPEDDALFAQALARIEQGGDLRTVFMPKQKAKRGAKAGRRALPLSDKLARHAAVDTLRELGVVQDDAITEVAHRLGVHRRTIARAVAEVDHAYNVARGFANA